MYSHAWPRWFKDCPLNSRSCRHDPKSKSHKSYSSIGHLKFVHWSVSSLDQGSCDYIHSILYCKFSVADFTLSKDKTTAWLIFKRTYFITSVPGWWNHFFATSTLEDWLQQIRGRHFFPFLMGLRKLEKEEKPLLPLWGSKVTNDVRLECQIAKSNWESAIQEALESTSEKLGGRGSVAQLTMATRKVRQGSWG